METVCRRFTNLCVDDAVRKERQRRETQAARDASIELREYYDRLEEQNSVPQLQILLRLENDYHLDHQHDVEQGHQRSTPYGVPFVTTASNEPIPFRLPILSRSRIQRASRESSARQDRQEHPGELTKNRLFLRDLKRKRARELVRHRRRISSPSRQRLTNAQRKSPHNAPATQTSSNLAIERQKTPPSIKGGVRPQATPMDISYWSRQPRPCTPMPMPLRMQNLSPRTPMDLD